LLRLFIVLLVGLLLASILSKKIVSSLDELRIITADLPNRLSSNEEINWGKSVIREIQALIDHSRSMAQTLAQKFSQIQNFNASLESEVSSRTRELSESKEFLQTVIDIAPVGISVSAPDGQLIMSNSRSREILGLPDEEQLGRNIAGPQWKIIRPDGTPMPSEEFASVRAQRDQQEVTGVVMGIVREDGIRWISVDATPSPDSSRGVIVAYADITERKQIERELEDHRIHLEDLVQQRTSELMATETRASRILESTAGGLYGVDINSQIVFINPALCRMLGYTADQVIGRPAHTLFHHSRPDGSPYPAEECAARHAWKVGLESHVDDDTYWHADGHPVPVALASHPIIENREITGAVISVVDVSEQRAAIQAREKALVAAENLAQARSQFLANMSHEIRTPMNGVMGFAEIGYRNCQNAEKSRNAFEKILASSKRLLDVVNEVLDFSKIDAGKLDIEALTMPLADAIDGALEIVAGRARAKGLDLRLELAPNLPEECVSDPMRIGQILLNLLSNAVKFTESGKVTLAVSRQGRELVFRVSDTGIGMNEDQLGYVFNPFQQADGSSTRRFGGTGLGLAICKRIVELMKGTITAESKLGAGSTFEFRLPYVEAVAARIEPPAVGGTAKASNPEKPLKGISILVAEDDEVNQMVLEECLLPEGARIVMVGDGRQAVERLIADGPDAYDLVLMDIQMPVMDGYEATRRLLELAPGLTIVGQTAHAFDEDRDKCLSAGMVAHIAKPIDIKALVALILQVVAARRGELG